jgi:hypothetical protein
MPGLGSRSLKWGVTLESRGLSRRKHRPTPATGQFVSQPIGMLHTMSFRSSKKSACWAQWLVLVGGVENQKRLA